LLSLLIQLTGCFRWKPDFSAVEPTLPRSEITRLLDEANTLGNRANNSDKPRKAIGAYEKVRTADPNNYDALCFLSTFYLLLGDGYTQDKTAKISYFQLAMNYAERAMYTHPDFRARIDRGERIWEAVDALTTNEMDAMFFWTTAVFYYYKEGLGPVGQVINYTWVKRARRVLERMTEIDPNWGGGAIYFTGGVYYLSIPEAVGGDRTLSAEYFAKAITTGPEWLLNRWGRAKYFHVKMKNPDEFKEDLAWVLAQDIAEAPGHFAWNAYFQNDAQDMLDRFDDYF
jgi:tetratricopeptide (TPR) repeat protein